MTEFLFSFPIILAIALVLGGCRARTMAGILAEAGKTFGRILVAELLIIVVLQGVLWAIPRIF